MKGVFCVTLILFANCVFGEKFVPNWKKQACEIPAAQNAVSHYTCTDDGEVKCLPGWNGDLCDVPKCKSGCDPLLGYCNKPNECLCKLGYWGENCDKCIPLPGCQHGYCNKSFECICKEGWDGIFCNEQIKHLLKWEPPSDRQPPIQVVQEPPVILRPPASTTPLDYSFRRVPYSSGPGQNIRLILKPKITETQSWPHNFENNNVRRFSYYGPHRRHGPPVNLEYSNAICRADCHATRGYCEQPGECRCKLGWAGRGCRECQVMPGCVHGYCEKPLECKCYPGWTGVICHIPLCSKTCHKEHGYCRKPGECRCKVGWWGKNCEKCFPYPGCANGSCRYPWECICNKGWGGMLCDEELTYCEKNPGTCKNGAMCISVIKEDGQFRCVCREGTYGRYCEHNEYSTTPRNPFVVSKNPDPIQPVTTKLTVTTEDNQTTTTKEDDFTENITENLKENEHGNMDVENETK